MKNYFLILSSHWIVWLVVSLPAFTLIGCRDEYDFEPGHRTAYLGLIDPAKQPDELNNALNLVNGTLKAGKLPAATASAGLSIDNFQSGAIAAAGKNLYIPFTFAQANRIAGIYLQVDSAQHYWDLRIQNATLNAGGNYVFPLGIPQQALLGKFGITYELYDVAGNVSRPVHTGVGIEGQAQGCANGQPYQETGHEGLTVRVIKLGNTPGRINIQYDMHPQPDRMDIEYNGQWVASTGMVLNANQYPPPGSCSNRQPGYVSGTGTTGFNYDPSKAQEFTIYMSGCYDGGTVWDFQVDCPVQNFCSGNVNPFDAIKYEHIAVAGRVGQATSSLSIEAGDYVFIGAKGSVVLGRSLSPNAIPALITSDPYGYSGYSARCKDSQYRYGQLLAEQGATIYPCESYNLAGCLLSSSQAAAIKATTLNEWGSYFIAQKSGPIQFQINDADLADNELLYEADVYVMPRELHVNRNCFNKCPLLEPHAAPDSHQANWSDYGYSIYDGAFELCYHGDNTDYLAMTPDAVKGCQCVYANGRLVNNTNEMGTFDLGYATSARFPRPSGMVAQPGLRLHFILDIFPQEAFTGVTYAPTVDTY